METIDKIDEIEISSFPLNENGALQLAKELFKILSEHYANDSKYIAHMALNTDVSNRYKLLNLANTKKADSKTVNHLLNQLPK